MRVIPLPAVDELSDEDDSVQLLDWKDSPATVLEHVDHLLEAFGLEVVQYETGSDDYRFKIEPRK